MGRIVGEARDCMLVSRFCENFRACAIRKRRDEVALEGETI